jgi:lipopolysaccharide transport system ATP-binding protein
MKDVSEKQGRTVLFVSHNMQAIANLSTKLITMHNGVTRNFPNPIEGIEEFTSTINLAMDSNSKTGFLNEVESNDFIKISSLYLTDENGINKSTFYNNERVCLNLECEIIKIDPLLVIGLGLYNSEGVNIFWSINLESAEPIQLRLGFQKIQMLIPSNFLNHGKYSIELIVALHNSKWIYRPHDNAPVLYFSLIDQLPTNSVWSDKRQGCLVSNVEYKKIDNWEQ